VLNPWGICALVPVIDGGDPVTASSGALHEELLGLMASGGSHTSNIND
jgi:hypothetical protein